MQPNSETSSQVNLTPVVSPVSSSGQVVEYGGMWSRFWAITIDGLILGLFSFVVTTIELVLMGPGSDKTTDPKLILIKSAVSIFVYVVQIAYAVYFVGVKGQTPGKKIMKIKVVKQGTNEVPGFVSAFLREFIGKFLSGIVLGLGYVAAFRDPKKRAWHDRIANTVVIKD